MKIAEVEPNCIGIGALHSPATGIVDYAEVARHPARDARAAGTEVIVGHEVIDVLRRPRRVRLMHRHGAIDARHAIFARERGRTASRSRAHQAILESCRFAGST